MVKIRLMRLGKKKQPYFRVVVADSRSPRDGRIIENIGKYHPRAHPSVIEIDDERAMHWLQNGAQPSDPVKVLLQKTGIWERFTGEAPPPPKPEKPPKEAEASAEAAQPEQAEPSEEAPVPPAETAQPAEEAEAPAEEVVAQRAGGERASDEAGAEDSTTASENAEGDEAGAEDSTTESDAEGDNAKEGDTA
jgi:small subunit ribosomal protein S16